VHSEKLKLPNHEDDPCLVENLAGRLFPQLSLENHRSPNVRLTSLTILVGSNFVELPTLAVDNNYPQMLSQLAQVLWIIHEIVGFSQWALHILEREQENFSHLAYEKSEAKGGNSCPKSIKVVNSFPTPLSWTVCASVGSVPVAKPARQFGHAMQISYHYSFL
jgi:hypothetical protein